MLGFGIKVLMDNFALYIVLINRQFRPKIGENFILTNTIVYGIMYVAKEICI